jgi:hypothetical protein
MLESTLWCTLDVAVVGFLVERKTDLLDGAVRESEKDCAVLTGIRKCDASDVVTKIEGM